MIFEYGETVGNGLEAMKIYAKCYLDRQLPSAITFVGAFCWVKEIGRVVPECEEEGGWNVYTHKFKQNDF